MKSLVFVGFLACLSLASARSKKVTSESDSDSDSKFNQTIERARIVLSQYDPACVKDLSFELHEKVTAHLKKASICGFSKFAFSTLLDDGENFNIILQIPEISASVEGLILSLDSGFHFGITQLGAQLGRISFEIIAGYTTKPLRVTTITVIFQLESMDISGTLEINAIKIDVSIDNDIIDTVNNYSLEVQSYVSDIILKAVNLILAIVDPA